MNKKIGLTSLFIKQLSNIRKILSMAFIFLVLFACKKDEKEFNLGSQFLESESEIRRVDDFTVELSTVIRESFPTNGSGVAMVGQFDDAVFGDQEHYGYGNMLGKVTCTSYFQLGAPNTTSLQEDDVYDGIKFILIHTGYSYGDTTSDLTINLYPMMEALPTSTDIYNDDHYDSIHNPLDGKEFSWDLTRKIPNHLIGSITYKPVPQKMRYVKELKAYVHDSVEVSINDTIGRRLFNMLVNKSDTVSSDALFNECLKGIQMVAVGSPKCIVNFDISQIKLRLYCHRYYSDRVDLEVDFPVVQNSSTSKYVHYNQINRDFKNSRIENLKVQKNALPSDSLNGSAILYGGVGLLTKVRFPNMPDFLLIKNAFIVKAELILKPKKGTDEYYKLPSDIMMYGTNNSNNLDSIYYNSNGTLKTATFIEDPYDDRTSYTFDLTSFFINELSDSYFNIDNGILISVLPDNLNKSFERLSFDAENPVLKLYYVTY